METKELVYVDLVETSEPALEPALEMAVEMPEDPEGKPKPKRNPRIKLPEAGGVAFADLQIFIKNNGTTFRGKITLTARGFTAAEALDNLMDGIKHANTHYSAHFLHK